MKKLLATTAFITLLASSAFATNLNSNNTNNNPIANGGNASQGQVGINSLENDILSKNNNKNTATGGNASSGAAALSGAISGSKSGVKNSGNSESESGVYGSGNSANLNAQVDASRTSNKQKQDASSSNNIAIGGDSFVEAENVVNTAYAPTVIATSDCLGSVSGGGMGTGFGASLGFTTNSNPCNIREDAKLVAALTKDENLVKATLCQSDRVKEAYKVTGEYNKYCVGAKATVKTKFWGLNATKAYEEQDVCAYPTPACKASKK
jgi:hypothetical protein